MFSICSPFVERSLSTVAELAFTLQLLEWFNISVTYKLLCFSSIVYAEIVCWSGIISGYARLHAIEESIWCCNAIFLFRWFIYNSYKKKRIQILTYTVLVGYIIYMIVYDIPMYIYKPNSMKKELLICEYVSTDIAVWNKSFLWMTGYFTFGSWVSLAIS
jgi:hypothetical protein